MTVEIYDSQKLRLRDVSNSGAEDAHADLLSKLSHSPSVKMLARVDGDVFEGLDDLDKNFPNFYKVIKRIRTLLRLECASPERIVKLPRFLLSGPPGIGKTRFLNELAKVLKIGTVRQVDMASTSSAIVLGGMTTSYRNAKQGVVTAHLLESQYANPIILLDEIDKVQDNSQNPMGPLFSLLEPGTAESFIDEALDFPINCSHIIWFATANNVEHIDDALRSRFEVINITEPTTEQMTAIVNSVYKELLAKENWGECFYMHLSDQVLAEFKSSPPRLIRKLLLMTCANALDRQGISESKLIRIEVEDIERDEADVVVKASIGFY